MSISSDLPVLIRDGRGPGVLRNTSAIEEDYQDRCAEYHRNGYLCVYEDSSRTGRTKNSAWLAPNRGFEGLEAWARFKGALIVKRNLIVVPTGRAKHLIGRGGTTIKKIVGHCGLFEHIQIKEASSVGGSRILYEEGRLVCRFRTGGLFFDSWWEFEGKIVGFTPEGNRRIHPPELQGLPYALKRETVIALENGNEATENAELAWLIMQDLPGYTEARKKL